jgi:hypothetical protein
MIRKFAAALVALIIAFGAVFAEDVRGTFVKFVDGTLTIKVDDKDKDYKIPADLTLKQKTKDGTVKEVSAAKRLGKTKEGTQITVTVDGDKVTAVKIGGKKKDK